MKTFKLLVIFALIATNTMSQEQNSPYIPDPNPEVRAKLSRWQDLKFGLLMHWGTYSQWGIVESWSICPEEYNWCERKKGSSPDNYFAYVKEYENLIKTFDPQQFDPEKWAMAAKEAGMRYVIFTFKHHDGFCMYDTKYTDYKVTSADCPFSTNPKSDIGGEILKAFEAQGFWTGAYFSKPDWHCQWYWNPYYPPRDRNVNYSPAEHPDWWQNYVSFTHNQILEIVKNYNPDILWLDGGWVSKKSKQQLAEIYREMVETSPQGYLKRRVISQDIQMDSLVAKARTIKKDLIVVDRAVYGPYQNYLTPENTVPDTALPYPWESCIISGGGWSYTPNAHYMSGRKAIHLLIDIVAKGGNLLLNIAPSPDGTWQQGAYDLLREYADWMKINSEAIYSTRPLYPYKENEKLAMTRKKDSSAFYFFYMMQEGENTLPAKINIKSHRPDKNIKVLLLGTNAQLKWKPDGQKGCVIYIPKKYRNNPPSKYACVIKISRLEM